MPLFTLTFSWDRVLMGQHVPSTRVTIFPVRSFHLIYRFGRMLANLRTATQMCRLTRPSSVLPATFVSCNTEGIFSLNLVHGSFIFASLQLDIIQRTLDPSQCLLRHVCVPLRRLYAIVTHQLLDIADCLPHSYSPLFIIAHHAPKSNSPRYRASKCSC